VILDAERAGPAAREIDRRVHVVHRMPRVLVVWGGDHERAEVAAIPAVVQALRRDATVPVVAGLSEGERLFVNGWFSRLAKRRPGDGRDRDAPGHTPPR
jgi:hypothetical protein